MKSQVNTEYTKLDRKAEQAIREKTKKLREVVPLDMQGLLRELEMYRVEIEIQNAGLRHAQRELQESRRRYADLYDSAPIGYLVFDRRGIIRSLNLCGARMLGNDRNRLIGQAFVTFVMEKDQDGFHKHLREVFDQQAKQTLELRLIRNEGTPLHVQLQSVVAEEKEGEPSCRTAIIDMTERREAEEAVKNAEEEANRATSQYLANMSHELRTPMTGVLGMLEIARSGPLNDRQREAIDIAQMSGQSLLVIMNDILDLSRIETGRLTLDENPFFLRECLAAAVNIVVPEARRKGLDLSWTVAERVPETLMGDSIRLQQVLTNLVSKAVKFTEKGQVKLRVTCDGKNPDGKRKIVFSVADTGIGIPDEKKERIFAPFSQGDLSHTRRFGGSGLGLTLCRRIVELMGGTIGCESSEGEGSTFTFTVSLAEAWPEAEHSSEPVMPVKVENSVPADAPARRKRLLIAEDDEATRKVLGFMLQKSEYDFEFAEDGLQVVEMWEKGKYDLIVMDGQMPGMDGFEATSAIRRREKDFGGHIPIVAVTAHAIKEDKERCLAAGMDAHVSKPIDFQALLGKIPALLSLKT